MRELAVEDLAELLALYQHLHAEDDPLPSEAELRRMWQAICADPGLIYLGAFDGRNGFDRHAKQGFVIRK